MKKVFILFFIICSSVVVHAQTYNVGDKITDFALIDITSGNSFSLNNQLDKKIVVLVFTSNSCPYSKLYEQRLVKLARTYEGQSVLFIFINPNNPAVSPEDNVAQIKEKASTMGLPCPYLADPKQTVANPFGATKTPEVFVLKNISNNFILKYKGAIDDNTQVATDVHETYLKNAIDATLRDESIKVTETKPAGCYIKR